MSCRVESGDGPLLLPCMQDGDHRLNKPRDQQLLAASLDELLAS